MPVLWLHRFRSGVMRLVLILWFCLLSYTVKFFIRFLLALIHDITSRIVSVKSNTVIHSRNQINIIYKYFAKVPVTSTPRAFAIRPTVSGLTSAFKALHRVPPGISAA